MYFLLSLLHYFPLQFSTTLNVQEHPLLCLHVCMCLYPGKQSILWVLVGLQLDSQEGRARVCIRREGNQFSQDLTKTLQQRKQS